MKDIAARIYNYLKRHEIDPDKVRIVLRCSDDESYMHLQAAMAMELAPNDTTPLLSLDHMRLNGITISLRNLDRSR